MHTMVWWSVWGLVVGIGLFGLKESQRASLHLILALPLLTGAIASAILRLRHEYHQVIQHAKWALLSTLFLFSGTGFLYIKSEAFGPFASGSTHRAFLKTTFEMSIPEVERTLGRKLSTTLPEKPAPDGIKEWLMDMVPNPGLGTEVRTLPHVLLYNVPCIAKFEFVRGKLAKVTVNFQATNRREADRLLERIEEELSKDYKPVVPSEGKVYRKDAVEATVTDTLFDRRRHQVEVQLQYLPLAQPKAVPLTANVQVF